MINTFISAWPAMTSNASYFCCHKLLSNYGLLSKVKSPYSHLRFSFL